MKKAILVGLLVILLFPLYAEIEDPITVVDFNGHDWIDWSTSEQISYMHGYLAANSGMWDWFYYQMPDATEKDLEGMELMFYYEGWTSESLADAVTEYYDSEESNENDYKNYKLHEVIMVLGGKDYWNYE
jgi:hypothetical protein